MTAVVTVPMTDIAAQERAIEEARADERLRSAAATHCAERSSEIDQQLENAAERRRREKLQPVPSATELGRCDVEVQRLMLEREAAQDAHRHATRQAEEAKERRVRAEGVLRRLHEHVRDLREAMPGVRRRIRETDQRIGELDRLLQTLRARKAADITWLVDAEKEIIDITGAVEEPKPQPQPVAPKPLRWFERVVVAE
jgi:chromosome segregation ATPase